MMHIEHVSVDTMYLPSRKVVRLSAFDLAAQRHVTVDIRDTRRGKHYAPDKWLSDLAAQIATALTGERTGALCTKKP